VDVLWLLSAQEVSMMIMRLRSRGKMLWLFFGSSGLRWSFDGIDRDEGTASNSRHERYSWRGLAGEQA